MALPSYESSFLYGGDVRMHIRTFLDLPSIRSLLLVNSQFYAIYSPWLWNDPLKWVVDTSQPFSNVVKFMRIARGCRKSTRDLVNILDFRALQALSHNPWYRRDFNLYETTISYEWIARHQSMFANLRFVVLDGLRVGEEVNFYSRAPGTNQPKETFRPLLLSYQGLHIDVSRPIGPLVKEGLMFLNISSTSRPEPWTRAMQETNFRNLRIIKLTSMRLSDQAFPYHLLRHNVLKLWSLDVRDNILGDLFIAVLFKEIFQGNGFAAYARRLHPPPEPICLGGDEELYEGVPLYTIADFDYQVPPFNTIVPMRNDSLDGFMKYMRRSGRMTSDPMHTLTRDDIYMRHTGLTHLHLSGNKLTTDGVHELFRLENNRLQVLDVGSPQVPYRNALYIKYSGLCYANSTSFAVVNCANYLKRKNGSRIEQLRIHHALVTLVPTVVHDALSQGYRLDHLQEAENSSLLYPKVWGPAFRPQDSYRLRELTLTDIPTKSYGTIINRLTTFLRLCYEQEALLAQVRNRPEQQHYRAPPLLSGLRVLKLEFLHPRLEPPNTRAGVVSSSSTWGSDSASVSGDRDADAFASSASGDFSFFSDNSRPAAARSSSLPRRASEQLDAALPIRVSRTGEGSSRLADGMGDIGVRGGRQGHLEVRGSHERDGASEGLREVWPKDVVEELKRFRLLRPRWSGDLVIIRPKAPEEGGSGLMGWQ